LLPASVFLDDEEARGFDPLVRRKAELARQTLPAAPDDALVVAGIDDAGLALAAGWADQVGGLAISR
jgi:hypothetical protein